MVLHYVVLVFLLTSRQSFDTPFSSITGASDIIVVFLWLTSHCVTVSACCRWATTASSTSITTSTAEAATEAHATAEDVHELAEEGAWVSTTTREA